MSSTSARSKSVLIVGYIFIVLIIYFALVTIDVISTAYLHRIDGTKAAQLERERACDEDYRLVDEAKALGYQSLLYPDLYDRPSYRAIAEKYGVAPLAPSPHTKVYYCNEGYGQVRYETDRYGFRNPDAIWDTLPLDAVLIGDSFVQGACVGNDSTITAILNTRGISSVNLGTGSNSPIHYAALATTFLDAVKTKFAVIVFYPNDNLDNEQNSVFNKLFFGQRAGYFQHGADSSDAVTLSDSVVSVYRESHELLAVDTVKLDDQRAASFKACRESEKISTKLRKGLATVRSHLSLATLYALVTSSRSENSKSEQNELPYGSKLAIDTLVRKCAGSCTPIIAYIPNSSFWRPDARSEQYLRLLKDYAEAKAVRFVDMSTRLSELGRKAYARRGPHLSPEGYEAVAAEIAEMME